MATREELLARALDAAKWTGGKAIEGGVWAGGQMLPSTPVGAAVTVGTAGGSYLLRRALEAQTDLQRRDEIRGKQEDRSERETPANWSEALGTSFGNIPGSALQFGEDVARIVTHPLETAEGLGRMAMGGAQLLGDVSGTSDLSAILFGEDARVLSELGNQRPAARAAADFYVDRYGTPEARRRTVAHDPVGVLADFSGVGGAAAASMPGRAGRIARAADPVQLAWRAAELVPRGAGKLFELSQSTGQHIGGALSGAGARALSRAWETGVQGGQRGRSFRRGMRQRQGSDVAGLRRQLEEGAARRADLIREEELREIPRDVNLTQGRASRAVNRANRRERVADAAEAREKGVARTKEQIFNPQDVDVDPILDPLQDALSSAETIEFSNVINIIDDNLHNLRYGNQASRPNTLNATIRQTERLQDLVNSRRASQGADAVDFSDIINRQKEVLALMQDTEGVYAARSFQAGQRRGRADRDRREATRTQTAADEAKQGLTEAQAAAEARIAAERRSLGLDSEDDVLASILETGRSGTEGLREQQILGRLEAVSPDVAATVQGRRTNPFAPETTSGRILGGPVVAGAGLAGLTAGGLSGLAAALPALASFSPRLAGEMEHILGRGYGAVQRGADAVATPLRESPHLAAPLAYQASREEMADRMYPLPPVPAWQRHRSTPAAQRPEWAPQEPFTAQQYADFFFGPRRDGRPGWMEVLQP